MATKTSRKKTAEKKSEKKTSPFKMPDNCPFRPGSAYRVIWTVLHEAGSKGITLDALVKQASKLNRKSEKKSRWDVAVVASAKKSGEAHRSANKAADCYWVEKKDGGWMRLHMRKGKS